MDLVNRGSDARSKTPVATPGQLRGSTVGGSGFRIASVGLLFATTALVIALLVSVVFGKPANENGLVDKAKFQAVFLTNGQVYFGRISSLNSKYLRLKDIFYLRVNQTVQPNQSKDQTAANDISLVKLGCELHGPDDAMVISRDQMTFWENLKADGQVAKAVDKYKKDNPKGQDCNQQAQTNTDANKKP